MFKIACTARLSFGHFALTWKSVCLVDTLVVFMGYLEVVSQLNSDGPARSLGTTASTRVLAQRSSCAATANLYCLPGSI